MRSLQHFTLWNCLDPFASVQHVGEKYNKINFSSRWLYILSLKISSMYVLKLLVSWLIIPVPSMDLHEKWFESIICPGLPFPKWVSVCYYPVQNVALRNEGSSPSDITDASVSITMCFQWKEYIILLLTYNKILYNNGNGFDKGCLSVYPSSTYAPTCLPTYLLIHTVLNSILPNSCSSGISEWDLIWK